MWTSRSAYPRRHSLRLDVPFFVSPDGVRLHYEIEGSGPPLVLHMGAGCDATMWREAGYLEPLSRASWRRG
jgi:pimeloyl-ACP methyl ester carboxylesterase